MEQPDLNIGNKKTSCMNLIDLIETPQSEGPPNGWLWAEQAAGRT